MKIFTADREAGNIIEQFETIEDAIKAIKAYEEKDKKNGDYTPDFYDIMDENNCSLENSPEAVFFETWENVSDIRKKLLSALMSVFAYTDLVNQDKSSLEKRQNLIKYRREYKELSEHLEVLLSLALAKSEEWKQECSSDDKTRVQRSVAEIKVLKKDLKYFNEQFNEQISQAEIK